MYYLGVRRATGSLVLRRICEQLLRDEAQHLRFHAERIAQLRRGRSGWRVRLSQFGHRLLFKGACVIVWLKHRRAFRAGGLRFSSYWKECQAENERWLERIRTNS